VTSVSPALAIAAIGDAEVPDVIALWQACGLTRPWNQSLGYAEQERIIYAKWLDGREPTP
jgi:hypothetical protein